MVKEKGSRECRGIMTWFTCSCVYVISRLMSEYTAPSLRFPPSYEVWSSELRVLLGQPICLKLRGLVIRTTTWSSAILMPVNYWHGVGTWYGIITWHCNGLPKMSKPVLRCEAKHSVTSPHMHACPKPHRPYRPSATSHKPCDAAYVHRLRVQ